MPEGRREAVPQPHAGPAARDVRRGRQRLGEGQMSEDGYPVMACGNEALLGTCVVCLTYPQNLGLKTGALLGRASLQPIGVIHHRVGDGLRIVFSGEHDGEPCALFLAARATDCVKGDLLEHAIARDGLQQLIKNLEEQGREDAVVSSLKVLVKALDLTIKEVSHGDD